MAASTGREVRTIHRLLEAALAGGGFRRHEEHPLECDLLVVDEASMVVFPSLRELLAEASPLRSGDVLAGLAAASEVERAVAQIALAEVPLSDFLVDPVVPSRRTR